MSGITKLVNHIILPKFIKAHQNFDHNEISQSQISEKLSIGLQKINLGKIIKPGQRICIACGSRGINNMPFVTKYMVDYVKKIGAQPFLIPAMGSHGGATAEGQIKVLAALGITEKSMGCPLLSSMEVVKISHAEDFDICIDKNALAADGIIVMNRIKAHTSFQGPYESGLMKMMTIGLGKQHGAYICHTGGDDNMSHRIGIIGKEVIKHANVLVGIALLENAFDKTCDVVVLPADHISQEEPKLLIKAKKLMGKLWFDSCDVLLVRTIGKNYSGAGMDPNVVGRCGNPKLKMGITSQRLGICDISEESHGNATGMGRADLATRKLFDKISFDETYPNCITDHAPAGYKIPVIVDSDEEVLKTAVACALNIDYVNPRIIIMNNSLAIENILISESMIPEAEKLKQVSLEGDLFNLQFDCKGNMLTVF